MENGAADLREKILNSICGKVIIVSTSAPGRQYLQIEGYLHSIKNIGDANESFWIIQSLKKDGKIICLNQRYICDFKIKDNKWKVGKTSPKANIDITSLKNATVELEMVSIGRKAKKVSGILTSVVPLAKSRAFWFLKNVSTKDKDKVYDKSDHLFVCQDNIFSFELIDNVFAEMS